MPLSFDPFQGQRLLGFSSLFSIPNKTEQKHNLSPSNVNGGFPEPTSVLDALRSPSSTTTTLSSSHGGGTSAAATDYEKCGQINVDDLDGVLSDSQNQEQSIFKLIMDGVFDPGFGFGSGSGTGSTENSNLLLSSTFPFQEQFIESPQIMNPEALINPNPCLLSSPPAKRFNSGSQPVFPFSNPGHDPDPDPFPLRRHQQFQFPFPIPFQFHQQSPITTPPPPQGIISDYKSEIIDQLFNAAELIGTTENNNGDHIILAQGILARLNQHLNNINKAPFIRAALHIVEVLNSLINDSSPVFTPENLILRIAAYKSFSETSPFLQFINFTTNQTILESFNNGGEQEGLGLGFDRIHIIDFDVGYGGQWASLMQELAGKGKKSKLSLKITIFASPPSSISDEFELRFTEENLKSFAEEVKIQFEIEILSLELLLNPAYWPLSLRSSEKEAIAVNLPISSVVCGYLPLILRFLKQISPNVVVSHDRGCDRNETPFPNAVINTLQYEITLLDSLHATNQICGEETVESIERFWIRPQIQNLLMKRYKWIERSAPWRSLFAQCGFSPASLSSTAEAQAECLLQRNSVKGFHVEKRQSLCSSLVLCWQRKELVSISAWR